MSRYRRWNELLELLGSRGQLQVEDAAKALNVSAATIRRDFDELASQQMLTRIRGGAVAEGVNYDLPLRYKTERHPSEKQRIGALAASMVRAGQVAGLNGGTTTTEVARALATRSDLGSAGPSPTVTVVTNALNIATELAIRQHIKIVTTGGVARPQSYELTGPLATGVLEQVTLDVAFLGVDGIDAVAGATAHHEGEASINRLMGRQARQVIIVADSSKVGQRAFARICTPAEIDVLVTDMTDPDWEPVMKRAAAIVTNRGGRTCHAAIVSRELGVPCVVGTGNGSEVLTDGQVVTVSCAEGEAGSVYRGALPFERRQVDLAAMPRTATRVMLNVGNPGEAFRLAALPNDGVGLARIEFIIASFVRVHPLALLHPDLLEVPVERAQLVAVIEDDGISIDAECAREGHRAVARGGHRTLP